MRKIAATASTGSAAVIATGTVAGLTGTGPGRSFRFGTGIRNLQQQKKTNTNVVQNGIQHVNCVATTTGASVPSRSFKNLAVAS
jgi:hypothetical protein